MIGEVKRIIQIYLLFLIKMKDAGTGCRLSAVPLSTIAKEMAMHHRSHHAKIFLCNYLLLCRCTSDDEDDELECRVHVDLIKK